MDRNRLSCRTNTSSESTCVQPTPPSLFRDWERLPPELLDIIVTKLGRLLDYIRFCGVCPQWRWVALRTDIRHRKTFILLKACRKKIPMLMMKTEEHDDDTRGLYSISVGFTYNIKLSWPWRNRFFGSSHGWLFSFEESKAATLLNPLNNKCIYLPVFDDSINHWGNARPGYYLVKGILSADPLLSPNNYMVVIIYDVMSKLAVYKTGDLHWKFIDLQPERDFCFSDVAFYKSNLYGVTLESSKLVQIDTGSPSGKTIIPGEEDCDHGFTYLLESQGELLLVKRLWEIEEEIYNDEEVDDRNSFRTETFSFKVYKMVYDKENAKWVQMSNIGERALFVGDNHCFSVSTIEFPECLLSNALYFNSQYHNYIPGYKCGGPDEDSGFFNLKDETSHFHHRLDLCERYTEPPIWFVPNPDFFSLD